MLMNDDKEEENWKNSEVMRIFSEHYLDTLLLTEEKAKEKTNNVSVKVVAAVVAPSVLDIVKAELESDVDQILERLARIGDNSTSQKVAYLVDRAINEIKDIKASQPGDDDV